MWLVRFVVIFCICYLPWPRVSKWRSHCGWVANLKTRVLDIRFECFRVGSILWLPRGPYGWYIMGLNSHDIPVEIDIVATGTWFSLLHLYKCWWLKSKWTLILILQMKSYLCSSKQGRWVVQVAQIRLGSLLNSMLYSNNDNALGNFWGTAAWIQWASSSCHVWTAPCLGCTWTCRGDVPVLVSHNIFCLWLHCITFFYVKLQHE